MDRENYKNSKRKKSGYLHSSSSSDDSRKGNILHNMKKKYRKRSILFDKPRTTSSIIYTDESASPEDDTDDWEDRNSDGSINMTLLCDSELEEEIKLFQNLVISVNRKSQQKKILQASSGNVNTVREYFGGNSEGAEPMDVEKGSQVLKESDKENLKGEINSGKYAICKYCQYEEFCNYVSSYNYRNRSLNIQESLKLISHSNKRKICYNPCLGEHLRKRRQNNNFNKELEKEFKKYWSKMKNPKIRSLFIGYETDETNLSIRKYRKKKVSFHRRFLQKLMDWKSKKHY